VTQYASKRSILLGLIGQDIQGSRTPEMHMREGEAQGLRHVYRLIDLTKLGLGVEALPELLTGVERAGFDGLNITHPCKQAVIPLLDELSDDARALGAVNTVLFADGKRVGHNTDWSGFAEPFRRKMSDVARERVVQERDDGLLARVGDVEAVEAHPLGGRQQLRQRLRTQAETREVDQLVDVAQALLGALPLVHRGRERGLDAGADQAAEDGTGEVLGHGLSLPSRRARRLSASS